MKAKSHGDIVVAELGGGAAAATIVAVITIGSNTACIGAAGDRESVAASGTQPEVALITNQGVGPNTLGLASVTGAVIAAASRDKGAATSETMKATL